MKAYAKILVAVMVVALMGTAAWATNVTFRVNMGVQVELGNFTVDHDTLLVRGTFNGWGDVTPGPFILIRAGVTDSIWTGTWDIAAGAIEYKFVIKGHGTGDVWEGVPNRTVTVASTPLELPIVYFNDVGRNTENIEIRFRVDMNVQLLTGNFVTGTDWVVVRGAFNGWGGSSPRLEEETVNPGVYSAWTQMTVAVGATQEYKYVILPAGDPNNARWESSSNRSFVPTGNEPDNIPPGGNGYREIQPALVYFSDISPTDIITNDLNVVFQVEDHPLRGRLRDLGYIYDVQTHDTIYTVDNTVVAGYFNNWPWGNFGQDYIMNDNGINGDLAAGDHIWSRSVLFRAGSPRICIYKFGCNMLDVEAGFAQNHADTLDDQHGATYYAHTVCWGSQDTLYHQWQHECVLAADDHEITMPKAYTLEQNYPNPFNPTTAITFVLPRQDLVTLHVFDLLGREAAAFNYGTMQAGKHTVSFDGSRFASGLYFYRLETPNFSATKKMLLMK